MSSLKLMADCLDNVRVGAAQQCAALDRRAHRRAMPSYPALGSLAYSLLYVLVCWLIVLPLYRKKIFIKI